jgi:chromosome segregation ATPase
LIKEDQVEKAAGILQEVGIRYPDLSDVCRQAERVLTQCRRKLADALYERAERAAKERKDFSAALGSLDKLEADFPDFADVLQKAKDLRAATQQSLDKYRAQTRYRALVADVTVALQGGSVPRTRELLSELEGLIQKGIEPEADLPVPQDAWQGYQTRLKALEARYDVDRKVFEAHLKQGNVQEARAKLDEMRGRYPLDPGAEELEKMLPAG